MSDQHPIYTLKSDVRFREVAGEGVVLRQSSSEILGVNQLGLLILQALQRGAALSDMVGEVCSRFDVEPGQAERDVNRYLHELLESNIIERNADGDAP
jgi:hypothetical protein